MDSVRRVLLVVALFCAAALAADGIEVLSHTEVQSGIEVLCTGNGAHMEAYVLVDGAWSLVDDDAVDAQTGQATLLFPHLLANGARIVLLDANGAVLDDVTYQGDGWR